MSFLTTPLIREVISLFKIVFNRVYLTKGDTARISISLDDDSGYTLSDKDLVYFIVTRSSEVVDLDDIDTPAVALYKRGLNITIYPEDTEDLEDGTYYYHVRVRIGGTGDLNTIIGPEPFILEPREEVY